MTGICADTIAEGYFVYFLEDLYINKATEYYCIFVFLNRNDLWEQSFKYVRLGKLFFGRTFMLSDSRGHYCNN